MPSIEERVEQLMNKRPTGERGKAPGADSIMWDTVSDMAFVPFMNCVMLMQTAHPDIGAAIAQYSAYKYDISGRLKRTLSSLMRFLYDGDGGEQSRLEAMDLRKLHARLEGVRPDGQRYCAIHPKSYRIVPDTMLDAVVRYREMVDRPLDDQQKRRLYGEYVDLCLMFGLRRRDIEATYDEFLAYYDDLLLNQMTYNETTKLMLEVMFGNAPRVTRSPALHSAFEFVFRRTAYPALRISTVGFMDPRFREKHGIPWSADDARSFERLRRALVAYDRMTPRWARYNPYALRVMSGRPGTPITTYEQLKKHSERERKKRAAA